MKHLKTFEEQDSEIYNTFIKLQYCRKCDEFTQHLDGKCLKCKKKKEQKKYRKKSWGVK